MSSDEEHKELLAAAGEVDAEGQPPSVPRCSACGHPLDDIEKMDDSEVARHLTSEIGKDLLRGLRNGTLTHQEMSIARQWLKDNFVMIDGGERQVPPDAQGARKVRRVQRKPIIPGESYSWDKDTDGG